MTVKNSCSHTVWYNRFSRTSSKKRFTFFIQRLRFLHVPWRTHLYLFLNDFKHAWVVSPSTWATMQNGSIYMWITLTVFTT